MNQGPREFAYNGNDVGPRIERRVTANDSAESEEEANSENNEVPPDGHVFVVILHHLIVRVGFGLLPGLLQRLLDAGIELVRKRGAVVG